MTSDEGRPTAQMIYGGVALIGVVSALVFGLEYIQSANTTAILTAIVSFAGTIAGLAYAVNKVSAVKEDTAAMRNGELEGKITHAVVAAIQRETPAAVEDVLFEHGVIAVRKHPRPAKG